MINLRRLALTYFKPKPIEYYREATIYDLVGIRIYKKYLPSTGDIVRQTGAIILIVVLLHYYTKINHIVLFWIAFIFTRPFGATFGDFLTKPLSKGGLDLGTLLSSLVSISILTILILISHRQHSKLINT
jgi:uncharacterized membrane-anchored protein